MESVNEFFLQALYASMNKQTVNWNWEITREQWKQLFDLAANHNVLPMVYEAVARCPAAQKADQQILRSVKMQSIQSVMIQARKTLSFLQLLSALDSAGVTPLVVKGIVCRQLYPNPDCRISGDEDVLIPESQFPVCHEVMLAYGMELADPEQDLDAFEVSYQQKDALLHIELHKTLFSPESDAYGDFNRYFEDVHQHVVFRNIQDVSVPTMNDTDHLFYLICHAFKHFLHSGFGIRQVCDICMFANAFASQIDWQRIMKQCEEIHADRFAAALFRIGEMYLSFQPDIACYPQQWRKMEMDIFPLLDDLLDSGVFGSSSMSRKHSSNMTLHAVSSRKQGKRSGSGVWNTLFPPAGTLSGRYPYLKERPYLLPVAWADRILKYGRELFEGHSGNQAAESVRIGNHRIELLRLYGIIDR